jgi:hypothetical protein
MTPGFHKTNGYLLFHIFVLITDNVIMSDFDCVSVDKGIKSTKLILERKETYFPNVYVMC